MSGKTYLGDMIYVRRSAIDPDDLILICLDQKMRITPETWANLLEFVRLTSEPDAVVTPAEAKA